MDTLIMYNKGSRDPRLVTVRRGGTLEDADHRPLAVWAAACAEHVLHLFEQAHPSNEGNEVIAQVPADLGYAPLVP